MRDFSDDIGALRQRVAEAEQYLRIDDLRHRRPQLETEASRPDLWDDQERARRGTGQVSGAITDIELFEGLVQQVEDAETLAEMAREESDESQVPEIDATLTAVAAR